MVVASALAFALQINAFFLLSTIIYTPSITCWLMIDYSWREIKLCVRESEKEKLVHIGLVCILFEYMWNMLVKLNFCGDLADHKE